MDGQLRTILDELEWAVERADRERAAVEQHERAANLALETARAEERAAVRRRAELSAALAEAAVTAEAAASRLGDAWSALAATTRKLGSIRHRGSLAGYDAAEGERIGKQLEEMIVVAAALADVREKRLRASQATLFSLSPGRFLALKLTAVADLCRVSRVVPQRMGGTDPLRHLANLRMVPGRGATPRLGQRGLPAAVPWRS
jgi:hypothetical protein